MDGGLNDVKTDELELIARASSKRPGRERWTTLTVWYRPEGGGGNRPFLVEKFGGSTIRHEVNRRVRRQYATLESAIGFFDDSMLTDELKSQAAAWLRRNADRPAVAGADATRPAEIVPDVFVGFDGAGGLSGALDWLYPNDTRRGDLSQSGRIELFEKEFGVPVRTVRHALAREKAGEQPTSWIKAFLGTLMFFDRRSFHLAAGRGA